MEDEILEGVEGQEVAEPVEDIETLESTEPNEETQEVVEPATEPIRDYEKDSAFAQMRRDLEAERKARLEYEETLRHFFPNDPLIEARAYAEDRSVDEIRAELEVQQEVENERHARIQVEEELALLRAEQAMERDLKAIQALDPTVKSIDELGSKFLELIIGGVDAVTAYEAVKIIKARETKKPPTEIGQIQQTKAERDYFTREEVQAMSQEEVSKNYEKIKKSMSKWK